MSSHDSGTSSARVTTSGSRIETQPTPTPRARAAIQSMQIAITTEYCSGCGIVCRPTQRPARDRSRAPVPCAPANTAPTSASAAWRLLQKKPALETLRAQALSPTLFPLWCLLKPSWRHSGGCALSVPIPNRQRAHIAIKDALNNEVKIAFGQGNLRWKPGHMRSAYGAICCQLL